MAELDISITSLEVVTDNENETMSGEHALPSLSIDVEDALIEKMEKEELHKAIKKLTKDEQELIYFHYFENRSETEIAKVYGISQQAISKKIRRIREKIKTLLKI